MHEIGHMFGLPNKNRKSIKKQHCADKNCIMTYKGFTISNNWIEKKYDKFHKAPFCSECLLDLEDRLNQ